MQLLKLFTHFLDIFHYKKKIICMENFIVTKAIFLKVYLLCDTQNFCLNANIVVHKQLWKDGLFMKKISEITKKTKSAMQYIIERYCEL